MRVEEAEKNLTAVQTQLEVHIAGEMNATDTPAKFARWGDERRRLELEVERHVKLVDLAWQEDENDQRRELIAAADAQRAANVKTAEWLKKEGAELQRRAEVIVRKIAEADVETQRLNDRLERLNDRLPADIERIAHIRSADTIARGRIALDRENITEKRVELWVDAETGNLVSDQTSVVDRGDGTGSITSGRWEHRHVRRCVRRRYRQIEFHPREQAVWAEPTYVAMRLPNFDRPGMFWSGDGVRSAQAALNLLKRDRSEPEREILVEIVPEGPWTVEPRKPLVPDALAGE
jgi:hypothetical protein